MKQIKLVNIKTKHHEEQHIPGTLFIEKFNALKLKSTWNNKSNSSPWLSKSQSELQDPTILDWQDDACQCKIVIMVIHVTEYDRAL